MSADRLVPFNEPVYLHITMVARLLGESLYVVSGLVETGELPVVKVDGRRYIDVDAVAAFREQRDSGAAATDGEERLTSSRVRRLGVLWTCRS